MPHGTFSFFRLIGVFWAVLFGQAYSVYAASLDQKEIYAVLEKTISSLEHNYLYPKKGKLAAEKLREQLSLGRFNQDYDFDRFGHQLETLLATETGDNNFELFKKQTGLGALNRPSLSENTLLNAISTDILENNIGYLSLTGDFHLSGKNPTLAKAIESLANTDALIIDLRDVDEGNIDLVQILLSYFLKTGTVTGEVWFNPNQEPQKLEVGNGSDGQLTTVPLFVLHSPFILGAWEYFSFALQHTGRATIVGQETMGLAHFIQEVHLHNDIYIKMTQAIMKGPDGHTSWQDHGVAPDYPADYEDALEAALLLAIKETKG